MQKKKAKFLYIVSKTDTIVGLHSLVVGYARFGSVALAALSQKKKKVRDYSNTAAGGFACSH